MKKRAIKRLLIANRGEIALRVMRACKELGIISVSVYSEADRKSLHVLSADEAYALPGSTPKESYLNQDRIIEIAKSASVDAVHPGYGFLAENSVFADLVEKNGILFVGPTGSAIRLMGDKTHARKLARQLGVPTIEGTVDPLRDAAEGHDLARSIGYPVLLKAAAGGGGKGMRVVHSSGEMDAAFAMAQSEAKGAFGDDRIYLEKYLDSPRHIEMQILADSQGHVVYLGERECSIQRRHQKIIEESPSTAVTDQLRRELGDAAVRLARAAGYSNAGTMEFLLDPAGKFYFLEMNTRLQVEHPVTEEVTGIDLVKAQIRIAEGEPLPFEQEEITTRGHSIECRICAEDPANSFMPSTGSLSLYRPPQGWVRVENGFREGDEISVYYDSLLAKVITWRPTRAEAISALRSALDDFQIEGVKSTRSFCARILSHKEFMEGKLDTHFIDRHFTALNLSLGDTQMTRAAAIIAALINDRNKFRAECMDDETTPASSKWKLSRGEVYRS